MEDRKHSDPNARVRAIVDDAIAELLLVGFDSREKAASLMAIQAIVRIESPAAIAEIAKFAAEMSDPN